MQPSLVVNLAPTLCGRAAFAAGAIEVPRSYDNACWCARAMLARIWACALPKGDPAHPHGPPTDVVTAPSECYMCSNAGVAETGEQQRPPHCTATRLELPGTPTCHSVHQPTREAGFRPLIRALLDQFPWDDHPWRCKTRCALSVQGELISCSKIPGVFHRRTMCGFSIDGPCVGFPSTGRVWVFHRRTLCGFSIDGPWAIDSV
jgi:hypothetical protein